MIDSQRQLELLIKTSTIQVPVISEYHMIWVSYECSEDPALFEPNWWIPSLYSGQSHADCRIANDAFAYVIGSTTDLVVNLAINQSGNNINVLSQCASELSGIELQTAELSLKGQSST